MDEEVEFVVKIWDTEIENVLEKCIKETQLFDISTGWGRWYNQIAGHFRRLRSELFGSWPSLSLMVGRISTQTQRFEYAESI